MAAPASVPDYLASLSPAAAARVGELMDIVRRVVPGCDETISYGIPTFRRDGRSLVHVAGWKRHVSIYPVPDGPPEFAAAIAPYVTGKGTATFPLEGPLPEPVVVELVTRLADRS